VNAFLNIGDSPVETLPAGGYRHGSTFITAEGAYAAKTAEAPRFSPAWLAIASAFCVERDTAIEDVPPAGDSLTQDLSERFATAGVAGSTPTVAAPPAASGGTAPGSCAFASPGQRDAGATKAFHECEVVGASSFVAVGAPTRTGAAG
jgi:hypothetical protein